MSKWPYSTARWKRLRAAHLALEPACRGCKRMGRLTLANTVDHVVAISEGGMPSPAMTASRHTAPLATAPRRRGVARLARCDRASPGVAAMPMAIRSIPIIRGTGGRHDHVFRSEEHTSELQSLMRISYAVFCLQKKNHERIENIYDNLK